MISCVRYVWLEKIFFMKQVNNRNEIPGNSSGIFYAHAKTQILLLYETFLKSAASNVCKRIKSMPYLKQLCTQGKRE